EAAFKRAVRQADQTPIEDAVALALCEPSSAPEPSGPLTPQLTSREREVLALIVQGRTDREIAAELFVSPRTVEWHRTNLFNKFGVDSRTALASLAVRQGLG